MKMLMKKKGSSWRRRTEQTAKGLGAEGNSRENEQFRRGGVGPNHLRANLRGGQRSVLCRPGQNINWVLHCDKWNLSALFHIYVNPGRTTESALGQGSYDRMTSCKNDALGPQPRLHDTHLAPQCPGVSGKGRGFL